MKKLTAKPGHRFVYAVTDADRWLRQPEPTQSVKIRQATAAGDPHSGDIGWDYTVGLVPNGGLHISGDMEHDPEYRPLFFALADFEVPTDTVAEVCAVLNAFGITDVTGRG